MKLKRVIPILGLTLALTAATACGSKAEDTAVRIYGEIEEVSEEDIIVDNQSDMSSQGEMILTIDPENTVLVDGESGLLLELSDVEKGSFVAYLGPAMTLSLPPQCTPEVVFTNVSEKEAAPYYAVIARKPVAKDGGLKVVAEDGESYVIPDTAEIKPFRTRNVVRAEDIQKGSRCLIWQNEQEEVVRVVLLDAE
ncbi:hypothetical protein ACTNCH_07550 [Candidatus Merdisoma sp. HCP28S3_D10]|uniref:hypothetical protein n=1 Tax=unclassified Candidatus Merdisoma TaxID=3099611 RepID=UPI003F8CABCF